MDVNRVPNLSVLTEEAIDILQFLISIDTSRGSEVVLAQYLRQLLLMEGLTARVYEPFPGRGSIVASYPGGQQSPLVLLSHLDTAQADSKNWRLPPFSGQLHDGEIWGRGSIDCKGLVTIHLLVFIMISRLGLKLDRDLYFISTAGEEEGGHVGLSWLLAHLPELCEAEYVLSEGGGFTLDTNKGSFALCQIGEKGKVTFSIHTRIPRDRIEFLTDQMVKKLETVSRFEYPAVLADRLDISSIGSNRVYVKGDSVTFETLPGTSLEEIFNKFSITMIEEDPNAIITITEWVEGTLSDTQTPLYQALQKEVYKSNQKMLVPFITPGYSDNRYFRRLGANVLGFQPLHSDCNPNWMHKSDERIGVSSLTYGLKTLLDLIITSFAE